VPLQLRASGSSSEDTGLAVVGYRGRTLGLLGRCRKSTRQRHVESQASMCLDEGARGWRHRCALPSRCIASSVYLSLSLSSVYLSLSLTLGFGQGKEMARVPTGRGWTLFFYPMKVVVVIDHNRMASTSRTGFSPGGPIKW
jgi:hypothetical protein